MNITSAAETAPRTGKIPTNWTRDDVIELVDGMARIFPDKSGIVEFLCVLTDDVYAVQEALEPLMEYTRAQSALEGAEELGQDLHEVLRLAAQDPNRLHQVLFTLKKAGTG